MELLTLHDKFLSQTNQRLPRFCTCLASLWRSLSPSVLSGTVPATPPGGAVVPAPALVNEDCPGLSPVELEGAAAVSNTLCALVLSLSVVTKKM